MKMTRRNALEMIAATPAAAAALSATPPAPDAVTLGWLGGEAPRATGGVSWGIPWPKGAVKRDQTFALADARGRALPLQQWTLATWQDGSVKWSGFATVAGADSVGQMKLAPGQAATPAQQVRVKQDTGSVEIDTGRVICAIARSGANLFESLTVDGHAVARNARLQCTLEDRAQFASNRTLRMDDFTSIVKTVQVEQNGPVRAVVRIEGMHKNASREWLPFTVRMYFYAGQEAIRLIHTIIFDGDDQKDFIRALGVTFDVPMREQVHNRHVRFSGADGGLWSEPVQPLTGRRQLRYNGQDVYADQLAGKRVPNKEAYDAAGKKLISDWAVWNAFKITQPTADGFTVQKRAVPQGCWLDAAAGKRASGFVFAGDVSGGLGVGLRNFWQSFPTSLEVENAATDTAQLTAWMWSPDAPAMDLRHYDTRAHDLDSSYEDVQPGFSTPHGVGRTSELTLFPSASVAAKAEHVKQAYDAQHPALLTSSPEHYHAARAFGIWSLPDRSHPTKKWVEDQLDAAFDYYQKDVEQRHWYGFWNYGDVMHTYDTQRHMWRYDIGGFAWDNSELGPDLWLWYSFLRSGRADVFRMAEAMTRHTGEVDTYHLGRFAKLGSRHNVRHWGCGAKELRISQAAYRRFFYYLTTDERTGDLMHEATDADYTLLNLDPMRLASPPAPNEPKYPARIRGGPDWIAAVGNWMTEWERTGNTKYRDKILAGIDSFARMKYGFISGPNSLFGYDPATGKLYPLVDDPYGSYNLQVIMGGAEVAFELEGMIDNASWDNIWLQYCRLVGSPKNVILTDMLTGNEYAPPSGAPPTGTNGRLAAYAYHKTKDARFAQRAWSELIRRGTAPMFSTRKIDGAESLAPIDEVAGVSTNTTAQWCLNAIQVLAMCGDKTPGLP